MYEICYVLTGLDIGLKHVLPKSDASIRPVLLGWIGFSIPRNGISNHSGIL